MTGLRCKRQVDSFGVCARNVTNSDWCARIVPWCAWEGAGKRLQVVDF
jgi:hypothetical protein